MQLCLLDVFIHERRIFFCRSVVGGAVGVVASSVLLLLLLLLLLYDSVFARSDFFVVSFFQNRFDVVHVTRTVKFMRNVALWS